MTLDGIAENIKMSGLEHKNAASAFVSTIEGLYDPLLFIVECEIKKTGKAFTVSVFSYIQPDVLKREALAERKERAIAP